MTATIFESEVCPRCGGSGHYSFNLVDGTKCYGCGGSGHRLTKRGAVAKQFYLDSLLKPLSEIKSGDKIFDTFYSKWLTVSHVERDPFNPDPITVRTEDGSSHQTYRVNLFYKNGRSIGTSESAKERSVSSEEERIEKLNAALDYQKKLTKTGKLMKKFQKKYEGI